jgi:hypothetical protein
MIRTRTRFTYQVERKEKERNVPEESSHVWNVLEEGLHVWRWQASLWAFVLRWESRAHEKVGNDQKSGANGGSNTSGVSKSFFFNEVTKRNKGRKGGWQWEWQRWGKNQPVSIPSPVLFQKFHKIKRYTYLIIHGKSIPPHALPDMTRPMQSARRRWKWCETMATAGKKRNPMARPIPIPCAKKTW